MTISFLFSSLSPSLLLPFFQSVEAHGHTENILTLTIQTNPLCSEFSRGCICTSLCSALLTFTKIFPDTLYLLSTPPTPDIPHYTVLLRYYNFYKSKVGDNPVMSGNNPSLLDRIFSNSYGSLRVSVPDFCNFHNVSNVLIIAIFVMVISGQWSWCYYSYCFWVPQKTVDYWINVSSDHSVNCSSPLSFPLLGPPLPWDTIILKLRQLRTLQWPLSVQVKEDWFISRFKSKARHE